MSSIPLFLFFLVHILAVQAQFEDDQLDLKEAEVDENMYDENGDRKYGVIAPGTKWCGQGSRASRYEDLGTFNQTDMCCRAHDQCPTSVRAKESFFNLINPDQSSRMSCECDLEFYYCLKRIQDVPSRTIGTIYFDILRKKCVDGGENGKPFAWRDAQGYSSGKFIGLFRKFV